jgi:hypothetical protein
MALHEAEQKILSVLPSNVDLHSLHFFAIILISYDRNSKRNITVIFTTNRLFFFTSITNKYFCYLNCAKNQLKLKNALL